MVANLNKHIQLMGFLFTMMFAWFCGKLIVKEAPVLVYNIGFISLSVLAFLSIVFNPKWGALFYLGILFLVPGSEGIGVKEISLAGVLFFLFLIYLFNSSRKKAGFLKEMLEIRKINLLILTIFVFFFISFFVALKNGISPLMFGRDLWPFLNILLILIIPCFINSERDYLQISKGFMAMMSLILLLMVIEALSYWHFLPFGFDASGSLLVPYIVLLWGLSSEAKKRNNTLHYVLIILALSFAFLAPGRTIWIGTILCLIVYLFFSRDRFKLRWIVLIILVVGILGITLFKVNSRLMDLQGRRFEGLIHSSSLNSANDRISEMKEATEVFLQYPILGTGFGYEYNFFRLYGRGMSNVFIQTNYTHSDFFNFLAKTGIVGTLLIMVFFLKIVFLNWKWYKKANEPESRKIYLMTTIITIVTLVIFNSTPILQSRGTNACLFFLIGLSLGRKKLDTFKEVEEIK